jgi:hypothetical protein
MQSPPRADHQFQNTRQDELHDHARAIEIHVLIDPEAEQGRK